MLLIAKIRILNNKKALAKIAKVFLLLIVSVQRLL